MTSVVGMDPTDDQIKHIMRMLAAMETMKEDRGLMSFSLGMVFLAVAARPGMSVKEYATMVGLLPSYVSRNLATLGAKERNGSEGLGLIELRAALASDRDTRSKSVHLTPKGEALRDKVFMALKPQGSKEIH